MEERFRQGVTELSATAERIDAAAAVDGDSPWFAGHFPGNPILPGIAILSLAKEAILTAELRQGRRVAITGVGRVRFRLPVKPGDRMAFAIAREELPGGTAYHVSVNLNGEAACTGTFTARPE